MPTIQEKADQVVRKVEAALHVDGFSRSTLVTESAVRQSRTVAALKQIEADLGASQAQERDRVIENAAQKLNIRAGWLRLMLREAGNDNYLTLVSIYDDLIGR